MPLTEAPPTAIHTPAATTASIPQITAVMSAICAPTPKRIPARLSAASSTIASAATTVLVLAPTESTSAT